DRNRSHWSTSKTPSYTKSVSWQHHPISATLCEWFISPEFHGCAFINASAEAKSEDIESEIKAICRDHKIETKNIIASLTTIADERVVNEIMLLIDGAIIHAQMGMETDEVITSLKRALADLIGG
ncbi:TetR/AcrR family transcriptional regulator, partial [Enterobacter roggenkampii]|nr:TetR/AcrR family transcriptional regulator [Enterobacter roggenkampii]